MAEPRTACMFICSVCHRLVEVATATAQRIGKCDACIAAIRRRQAEEAK